LAEHGGRFGLAQLHQLRGRVGRGSRQSSCILLFQALFGETAKARLAMMRETEDGFRIAGEDSSLRGGGKVLGSRQSGVPEYRVANVPNFQELLGMARDDATLILANDPELASARGQALRILLYLFDQDEAVRLFRAGGWRGDVSDPVVEAPAPQSVRKLRINNDLIGAVANRSPQGACYPSEQRCAESSKY
jgi:ATP-dependent DNA helicase RecG